MLPMRQTLFKKNYLKNMTTHSGDKTYQCSLCGKSFTRDKDLQKHLKMHAGEENRFQYHQSDKSHSSNFDL